jgi:RNA polymerase sigma factor (sigma-70 family)
MRRDQFPATRWTLVLHASQDANQHSQEALAILCQVYWYPLYAFVRRQGYSPEEAQDLTQSFFARLLESRYVRDYQRERGRFRSFLLGSLKHFLANQRERERAQKRGSGRVPVSLEAVVRTGETRYSLEPVHRHTPEFIFEKQWALAVVEQTLRRLETEQISKLEIFSRLRGLLTGDESRIPYKELAKSMNVSEGSLRVALHRLRRRFAEVLQEEIAHTLSDPDDIRDEIRYLLSVLAR